jgi:hypothetical protein
MTIQTIVTQRCYCVIVILDFISTSSADQMDVWAMPMGGIDSSALLPRAAADEALLKEEVERAIDCGSADCVCLCLNCPKNFINGHVPPTVRDDANDHLALWRDSMAALSKRLDN